MTLTGLTFFVNAFFGVWTAFVIGVVFLVQIWRGELPWRKALVQGAIGAVPAVLLAAPVVLAVLANPEFGQPQAFDYAAYLNEYYPIHFLFASIGLAGKLGLVLIVAAAASSFVLLGQTGRPWIVALVAACALYILGIAVSYATHSATILNLHLLRSSTLVHLLAAFGLCALATRWLFDSDKRAAALAAPVLIILLALPVDGRLRYPALALLAVAMLAAAFTPLLRIAPLMLVTQERKLRFAAIAFVLFAIPALAIANGLKNNNLQDWANEWSALGAWARQATPQNAAFLIPPATFKSESGLTESDTGEMMSTVFEYTAHRVVWIDFKRGAAAMWSPSTYATWHQRVEETDALASHESRLAYARDNNLAYVVEVCLDRREAGIAYATGRLCVYPTGSTGSRVAAR